MHQQFFVDHLFDGNRLDKGAFVELKSERLKMRNIIAGVVLTICILPIAAGSMKLATEFTKITPPQEFSDLTSQPLWTVDARRVDVASQNYERIPGILVPEEPVASAKISSNIFGSKSAEEGQTAEADNDNPRVQLVAQQWCSTRYRSYDRSDNSYQPYGGAARKPCVAPATTISEMQDTSLATISSSADEHVTWCSSRYSSYRMEDNSYQPFSGKRKQCRSPVVQSASNHVASSDIEMSASIN
ncbi:BA14K family protein [Agrobacterium rosae]|uniref:BA14K family protein n=1 Tax=Agrobacterium rosae TaxID=1972867 RepID=UPI003BA2C05F